MAKSPSGNAVPGASVRPINYPVQLVIMVSQATGDRIAADAKRHLLPKSQVARTYLEAGIEAGEAQAAAEAAAEVSS